MARGNSRETVDLAAQTTILRRRSWRRLGVAGAAFILLFSVGFSINLTEIGVPADVYLFGTMVALGGVTACVVAAAKWWLRFASVRRTGWHEGTAAIIAFEYRSRSWREPEDRGPAVEYSVTFPGDGHQIRLRRLRSIHRARSLVGVRDQPARVGGEGNQMVVLFAGGKWTGRPCLVPVKLLPEGTYRRYGEN